MAMYVVLLLGQGLARVVPYRWLYALAGMVGSLAYHLAPAKRRAVIANLRQVAGPELSQARLEALARQVMRHAARNYLDTLTMSTQAPDAIASRIVEVKGYDLLETALAAGRGAILVAPHMGNMDLVVQYLAIRHVPISIPMEHTRPEYLFRLFQRMRGRLGVRLIPAGRADGRAVSAELLACLRRGEAVGLVADRNILGTGVEVPFFGRPAALPAGPALLALRSGAPLIGVHAEREPGGKARGHITRIVHLEQRGNLHESVRAGTTVVAALLEEAIRAHMEQWSVLVPLWESVGEASAATAERANTRNAVGQ